MNFTEEISFSKEWYAVEISATGADDWRKDTSRTFTRAGALQYAKERTANHEHNGWQFRVVHVVLTETVVPSMVAECATTDDRTRA